MSKQAVRLVIGFSFLAGITLMVVRFGLYTKEAVPSSEFDEEVFFGI